MSNNLIQLAVAAVLALPVGKDPTLSQVSMLAHFDGADGATSTYDDKGRQIAFSSSSKISTARSKFGGASASFTPSSWATITNVTTADLPGTGDFTAEMWVWVSGFNSQNPAGLLNFSSGSGLNNLVILINQSFGVVVGSGPDTVRVQTANNVVAINSWNHIAVTRKGTTVTIWINGVQKATATVSNWNITDTTSYLGYNYGHGTGVLFGFMDEFRYCKGIAIYETDFAVPTAPFALPSA